jgi:hypothetical protein
MGGGYSTPRTGHFTRGKETRYPLYRRLGGPQAGLDVCVPSFFFLILHCTDGVMQQQTEHVLMLLNYVQVSEIQTAS